MTWRDLLDPESSSHKRFKNMRSFLCEATVWLLQPLSGSSTHDISPWMSWHGRLMVLSWGLLLPLGVLVARFFKVMPGQDWPRMLDNKLWWKVHLHGQSWALALALVGMGLVWGQAAGANALARCHGLLGWTVMGLGALQALVGFARGSKGGPTDVALRGDHYDMTALRKGFERIHKALGYLALLLACTALGLGLVVADAPRWMVLGLGLWWLALAATFGWLQAWKRCIDTYQAIWGPDPRHPGNQMKPIGWGIHRPDRFTKAT